MLGAVIGDIIGSTYEWHNVKTKNFELFPAGSRFTDDTVLSVAVADALLNREHSGVSPERSYAMWYRQYYRRYPHAGFGFHRRGQRHDRLYDRRDRRSLLP